MNTPLPNLEGLNLKSGQRKGVLLYHTGQEWAAIPPGASGQLLTVGSDGLPAWVTSTPPSVPTLSAVRVYTANETWSKPAGLQWVRVRLVGGGGGGGGSDSSSGTQVSAGAGGKGGGYSEKVIFAADLAATEIVTVGAGGSGGSTSGGNGSDGGDSSFGTHLSGEGGEGGDGMDEGSANGIGATTASGGNANGGASGGDINIDGEEGASSLAFYDAERFSISGRGGNSVLGAGGAALVMDDSNEVGDGLPGTGYGGGGSGGNSTTTSGNNGGDGAAGVVIVEEWTA